ncbi:MAG: hypothetical protein COB07_09025 [Sulfurovum sp.]|nr:MAG: hypothetical protein COB07_09025 [Sulfurovum sp.]
MTLPAITLPKVELPFDISVLLHPSVVHFMIALPVVIFVLELLNLMMKKKALSGFSFFLIILTVLVSAGAYLTGLVDGKEAYPALGEAAKSALAEHKLLGTYLMLTSAVLLFFKLLSMLAGGFMKTLYLLVLIVFVAGIFKQGTEGGELVYKHGMNVEQVKVLDDELFDVKEELEEAKEELEEATVITKVSTETVKSETVEVVDVPVAPAAKEVPTQVPSETTVPDIVTENIKTEVPEVVPPAVQEKVETLQSMPEEMVQPQIATH